MNLLKQDHLNNSLLNQIRYHFEILEIHNLKTAKLLCKLIPSHCPFERTVSILGRKLFHIPPLCKINPLYEEIIGLRYKCLFYLVDECGEDAAKYC